MKIPVLHKKSKTEICILSRLLGLTRSRYCKPRTIHVQEIKGDSRGEAAGERAESPSFTTVPRNVSATVKPSSARSKGKKLKSLSSEELNRHVRNLASSYPWDLNSEF
ncbi:unnamed protein product [Caretta caretta]